MTVGYPTLMSCRETRCCADVFPYLARTNREQGTAAQKSSESHGAALEDNNHWSC
jgi:hypothetical protein